MKRLIILLSFPMLILGTTACGVMQQDPGEIKVIPKPKTEETGALSPGKNVAQNNSSNSNNAEIDDKLQSLKVGTEEYIRDIIEERSRDVLTALKNKDMVKLSQAVHPDRGVRFSPYGHVDTKADLVFTANQIKNIASDTKVYTWGSYDGSGEPIQLTFMDYYNKFVYDEDFLAAKETGYNKILGIGNTLINSSEVYPQSIIVEYHFPGFDPQYEGMDWRSLRLVFEKMDTTWYLVGIIHDQWTI